MTNAPHENSPEHEEIAEAPSKKFQTSMSREDLDRVNDAQKERFDAEVRARGGEAYTQSRIQAYRKRWAEALIYVPDGATILDIGGGYTPQIVLDELFRVRKLDYWYIDIDQRSVNYISQALSAAGLPPEHAVVGDNTALPFPDNHFDAVFSSHCMEHSVDLPMSLAAIRRVLKSGGIVFIAVPFGFDDADEHIYFFEPDEWVELLSAVGFDPINTHVGRVYADPYWDLAMVARKHTQSTEEAKAVALAAVNTKLNKTLVRANTSLFHFPPEVETKSDGIVIIGVESSLLTVTQPLHGQLTHLIYVKNQWAGVFEITDDAGDRIVVDAYMGPWHLAVVDVSNMKGTLHLRVIARNKLARDAQLGIFGALYVEQ